MFGTRQRVFITRQRVFGTRQRVFGTRQRVFELHPEIAAMVDILEGEGKILAMLKARVR
ncbi:hypothetical protein [Brasilonema sp. UFV-L1]|uniref:hypothetical protein n=1 Tax=Brasilonema sp. UFV-L1 TaxID=2234130 RepID=UPI00145C702B|nr:hypothetical protein [Brasilonema sp. UFV-L1]